MYEQEQRPGFGAKVGFFLIFVAAWVVLSIGLRRIWPSFEQGGWGMWPILAAGMIFALVSFDRVRYLFLKTQGDQRAFVANTQAKLMQGDLRGAIAECEQLDQPVSRIVRAGLATLDQSDRDVQDAVDEAALYELPKIEKRTGYLAMIGNVATLLGLLGTIIGLIKSFAGVSLENADDPNVVKRAAAYVDLVPACAAASGKALVHCIGQNKATILAKGISEAMNCTAFGLMVGIVSLLFFSLLNGRTQRLLDDINRVTVYLTNFALSHRSVMKSQ